MDFLLRLVTWPTTRLSWKGYESSKIFMGFYFWILFLEQGSPTRYCIGSIKVFFY